MVDDRLVKLIIKLHERTTRGELHWQQTPEEHAFSASFAKYSTVVASIPRDFMLRLHGPDGRFLESIRGYDLMGYDQSAARNLEELYEMARREALGVDQAIDDLLAEVG